MSTRSPEARYLDPHQVWEGRVPSHDVQPDRVGYVVGFALDDTGRVALIRKARPQWQAGLLNGVGGHIEPGEAPMGAMVREFAEETGAALTDWDHLATLVFPGGALWVLRTWCTSSVLDGLRTTTDEEVVVASVSQVCAASQTPETSDPALLAVGNLSWLLPLATYTDDIYRPIVVHTHHT